MIEHDLFRVHRFGIMNASIKLLKPCSVLGSLARWSVRCRFIEEFIKIRKIEFSRHIG